MLARASPRKPYVPIDVRSSKSFNFDVVNRSQRIGRSSRCDTYQPRPVARKERTAHVYPVTIVGDLKELQSALFYQNLDRSGPGIDGVFNKFFQCVHWRYDDFAGSDLIDNDLV
jgi:hypothetical protein